MGVQMAGRRARRRTDRNSPPGRLRIVAGKWRSRLVPVADVPGLRPTSERIRETLFNWLAPRIEGARCLDLFAGSGALGFEALSRGAASVVFVERDELAANMLQEATRALDAEGATLVRADARRFLETCPAHYFDLVFLDPPFADYPADELCTLLDASGCLTAAA